MFLYVCREKRLLKKSQIFKFEIIKKKYFQDLRRGRRLLSLQSCRHLQKKMDGFVALLLSSPFLPIIHFASAYINVFI